MSDELTNEEEGKKENRPQTQNSVVHLCDRCGFPMIEKSCKVECPNCGNRFDCSDLNIYFD